MAIALIDANSFYCSAELLFQPWLRNKPIVVASNNDGCVVSRNDSAKALGIKMGQPVFELRVLLARNEVKVFSSNYELYQSLSNRLMAILEELTPGKLSINSIDEAFANLSGVPDPEVWGRYVRNEIQRRLGLPVGIGISSTKTQAKLANWAAKRWKAKTGCVVDLRDRIRLEKLLRYAPVGEVWGIGPRLNKRLADEFGITTAWQLASADPKLLRRRFSATVERTARELQGIACFPFADGSPERKQMILCSRSFGEKVFVLEQLERAVATFTAHAAVKLRQQASLANCLQVLARTSLFSPVDPFSGSRVIALPYPTDDTRDLVQAAIGGLRAFYLSGPAYVKAGVVLSQFVERGVTTGDLFAPKPRSNSEPLMGVMDAINAKHGRGTVRFGRENAEGSWAMRRELLSPEYTTSWQGLPRARCGSGKVSLLGDLGI
ncbi:translesion error-prone DNA polymerase V subunit UmuC [Azotobacter chroococcum]|uniref:DNA polymerase V subunit UmuC n=1 Tax=Azotobacter chroococcum NCIMB 8003 TaxID=1328314 RepID=A0A0C4WT27_9GAMM|nr:translesion error-prone DNA polymerase V subunit UmuC [Azotobacter chroococcum]AJE23799.1 DNA polymerase V subunit UmuC [Azotobacter chroococcum NCIMB 8003]